MNNEEQFADYTFGTDSETIILRRYRDGTLYLGTEAGDLQAVGKPALRWWLRECLHALAEAEVETED